jgi:cytochrome c
MRLKTSTLLGLGLLAAIAANGALAAQDGAELYKTKTCFSCHGEDAKTPILPAYPKLAGQNADYLVVQMKEIKSGARKNGQSAAMAGIMLNVNEEEMQIIASWLATQ